MSVRGWTDREDSQTPRFNVVGRLSPSVRHHFLLEVAIKGWLSTSTYEDRYHRRYGATMDVVVGTHEGEARWGSTFVRRAEATASLS